ncbi:hypothetical protein ES707_15220 [subsurface metagenome]
MYLKSEIKKKTEKRGDLKLFEEIPFVLGFLLVSLVLSVVFFGVEYKPLKIAVQVVAIVGVIVHEISHILMSIVINVITLIKE